MKCHICGEDAESICLTCNSYYCESCFKFVHEKKKNVGHKKEIIDLYVPIMTKCPVHTDVPLNLFCLNDKELCCSMCQCLKPHEGHKHIPINFYTFQANQPSVFHRQGFRYVSSR